MRILVTDFESLLQKVHYVRQLIMSFMWDENTNFIIFSYQNNKNDLEIPFACNLPRNLYIFIIGTVTGLFAFMLCSVWLSWFAEEILSLTMLWEIDTKSMR